MRGILGSGQCLLSTLPELFRLVVALPVGGGSLVPYS